MYAPAMGAWFGASAYKGNGNANPYQADDNAPASERKSLETLSKVGEKVEKLKAPTGKKDAPAKSCHDFREHNSAKAITGVKIWVDPNQGGDWDMEQVTCEFLSKIDWTCIHPKKNRFEIKQWVDTPLYNHTWFSDIQSGGFRAEQYEFSYDVRHRSQLEFLALSSSIARQEIAVNCTNTVAYYDDRTQLYDKAVRLRSFDEKILTEGGKRRKKGTFKYAVDSRDDGCMTGNVDASTLINIRTKKTSLLPIIDIAVHDAGAVDQQFGFELGPVCFGSKHDETGQ